MASKTRAVCAAGCGYTLREFLDLGTTPLADRFPAPGEREEWYRLRVAVCEKCWLMQLRDIVDDRELYGRDYGFMTGSSPALVSYYEQWAQWAMRVQAARCREGVVEIACNDGTLLEHFKNAGCSVTGVEPSGASAQAMRKLGSNLVKREPFTAELAKRMAHLKPGLVIACNVMAHVTDPADFLAGIAILLRTGGAAVIEFQYAGDLLTGCMFDNVYHEHRFFYSLRSFAKLADQAGLSVQCVERTAGQGGSLRVTLAVGQPLELPMPPLMEIALHEPVIYAGMQPRAEYIRNVLLDLLTAERDAGRVVAGWGATAKSCTLLNFCGISTDLVSWVEDLTIGKIGHETPGSRIPIVAPSDRKKLPDTYLLLAWNYLGPALDRSRYFRSHGGRFIVPGPVPVII